jgi:hypothetical protein
LLSNGSCSATGAIPASKWPPWSWVQLIATMEGKIGVTPVLDGRGTETLDLA